MKGGFVSIVVAEICNRRAGIDLLQQSSHRIPFVCLRNEDFDAPVKLQEMKAVVRGDHLPSQQDSRSKIFDGGTTHSAPVDRDAAILEFRGIEQLLGAQPSSRVRQSSQRAVIRAQRLGGSIDSQTLQSVNSPDFGPRLDIQQRRQFVRIAAGNYHDPGAAIASDLPENEKDFGVRKRLVSKGMEGGQRSIVIKQKRGLCRHGNGSQERFEFALHTGSQCLLLPL